MASALAGLGSSLDINSMVTQLMAVERVPLDNLAKRTQKYQSELSAFGTVKSTLSSLQSAAEALAGQATSRPAAASSSDASVIAATAQSGAAKSTHSIEVHALAQAHKLYGEAYAATDAEVGTGTLTIEFGKHENGSFTTADASDTLTITITEDNNSLADIRDAINAANGKVAAAIVNDGSGYRLVLTSTEPGAASSMRIRVADGDGSHTDAEGLSALAFDPQAETGGGRNLAVARTAQDADFTLDGLRMTRPSNTVSDAVDNVLFTLNKTGSASVAVAPDAVAARTALDTVVKAYNSAMATLKNLTSYDAATQTGSVLLGESTVRNLQSQMRSVVNGLYGNESDAKRTLSAFGVSLQSDGSLSVNTTRYDNALADAPAEAGRVITGAAQAMADMLDKALDSEGILAARTSGIQSSIRQISDQQSRLEARMTAIEARYRAQFSALESLVSTMTSTNDYLAAQFDSLNNNN